MARRALSCRVIPVPGRWAEIDAKIVFMTERCSTVNCSKSVNSFRQNGFCVRFFRPWLSFGGVKSQNEFVTKPVGGTKGSVHEVGIVVAKIDVSLEFDMHIGSRETLRNNHLGLRKTPDLPGRRYYMTRRALCL